MTQNVLSKGDLEITTIQKKILTIFLSAITFLFITTGCGDPIKEGKGELLDDFPRYKMIVHPEGNLNKTYYVDSVIVHNDNKDYRIAMWYWPNGGETTFFDYSETEVKVEEDTIVKDDEGKHWVVRLTTKEVKSTTR